MEKSSERFLTFQRLDDLDEGVGDVDSKKHEQRELHRELCDVLDDMYTLKTLSYVRWRESIVGFNRAAVV